MIVLDASAAIAILLQLANSGTVMNRIFADGETLHAPHLIDVEVTQVVRRYWRAGDITPGRGADALSDLSLLPLQRYSHEPLLARIWQLRNNVSAYDAAYIALAEGLDATFVTMDSALARIPGGRVPVEVY